MVKMMIFIFLYDGDKVYTVPAVLFDAVRYQVKEAIPFLVRGKKYTLRWFCGEVFWQLLGDGDKRMAGRCMAHMVFNGQLPLRFAKSKHEYPKHYQLLQH